jgi:hypothetical protein
MAQESDLVELLGCTADEHLLDADDAELPHGIGRPEPLPEPTRRRGGIVAAGATMTGATLVGGIILFALGGIEALSNGSVLALVLMLVGIVFVATHWGWVHVAEFTANSVEGRRAAVIRARNREWLASIRPYTRHVVATRVADDGSICILRSRFRPVRSGGRGFRFVREVESEELHSAEAPAAEVTERAEHLRREATRATERERERYEVAADAYETALLHAGDEQERLAARRAASAALSEQINAHLRDPPLIE